MKLFVFIFVVFSSFFVVIDARTRSFIGELLELFLSEFEDSNEFNPHQYPGQQYPQNQYPGQFQQGFSQYPGFNNYQQGGKFC